MNISIPTFKSMRGRSDDRRSLQQAVHTLRGIRQRYELEHARHLDVHTFTVHVALGNADMRWIAAVIEVLEESVDG